MSTDLLQAKSKPAWPRVLLILLLCASIGFACFFFRNTLTTTWFVQLHTNYPLLAPILFISVYAVGTVVFFPGLLLTTAGGLLFGVVWGSVLNLLGALIGSSLAFFIARFIARDWVLATANTTVKTLMEGISAEGWKCVAFVRLVPLFPFNVTNYALGVTSIRFSVCLLTSAVTMLPATVAYTALGALGQTALTGSTAQFINHLFLAIGLILLVTVIPLYIQKWRQR